MNKQDLRNALTAIEDEARRMRNTFRGTTPGSSAILDLVVRLTQIVRQEILK